MSNEILNNGLNLSMEFGENWLTDIDDRVGKNHPKLTKSELRSCDKLCRKVNKTAHDFIRKNPIKNGEKIDFIDFSKFEDFMKIKYEWIDNTNLKKLYSQSCYYALK